MIRVYIMVAFWSGVLAFIIRMFELALCEFPRNKETTIGEHLSALIINILLTVWAGLCLFGGE